MPNWCMNYAVIKNPDEQKLQRFVDAYNAGETMQAFHPCPQELLDTVAGYPATEEARAANEHKKHENRDKYGYEDWYGWKVGNWGTKWDFGRNDGEPELKIKTKRGVKIIEIGFDTAWSPPIEFYDVLFEQFGFAITAYYFEPGIGFCGSYRNGKANSIDIEDFTPTWLKKNVPKKLLDVFNMIEEAEEMIANATEWEARQETELQDD